MILFLTLLYIFSGVGALVSIAGVIYPGYMSLKSLKNDNKLDNMLWLSYWIWYGLFTLIESITDILLFWVPMYEFIKMGFYIYLYAPNTKGALFLYRKLLQPLVIKFQQFERQFIKNVQEVKKNISDDSVEMSRGAINTSNTSRMNTTSNYPNYPNINASNNIIPPRSTY